VSGYWLALGDLPPKVLLAAAAKIAATRVYRNYPMPGEIRAVAAEILAGDAAMPTFAEAWRIAIRAARRMSQETDPNFRHVIPGSGDQFESPAELNERILAELPPTVAKTLRCFGPGIEKQCRHCGNNHRSTEAH
jgi:hypothetical protein